MNAVPRSISFLAASKSIQRLFIGHLLRGSGCIPVQRPQDVKQQKGPGKLTDLSEGKLTGNGTKFTKLTEGTTLHIDGPIQLKIKHIISDTEAEVQGEAQFSEANLAYKYLLRLDFNCLYESFW